MKKLLMALTPLALLASATLSAHAADFPIKDKVITLVVPFAAGGPTDRVARDLAEAMRKPLGGATVVVDNAAGAGGSIGANKVAKASNDGYTLLVHHIGMGTMPTLVRNVPFKVESDFEYLGMINDVPMTLIGKPSLPANNYRELTTWIGQNKGKINLGNAGVGSASHLCGLLFQEAVKTDMTPVPYKGTAPAMTDLIGGQIDIMCDLPTLQESGLKDFNVSIWHGLYAPKGVPADVLKKLNDALKVALKDPDFIKKQEGLGAVVVTDKRMEPAEHKKFVAAEIAKWSPIIKAAGVYAD
ncbi:MAG: tripartite tricarboxylate transporter substrate-binding protein [Pseudomonadota bacterium]